MIVVGSVTIVALLFAVTRAQAQPKPTTPPSAAALAEARRLFGSAARAYDAGRFDVAVRAFDQAYELAPRVSIRFSAAQALRRLHAQDRRTAHLEKALGYYRQYLTEVKEGRRVKDAAEAVNALEVQLAKLIPPTPAGDDDDDDDDDDDAPARPRPKPVPASQGVLATVDLNSAPPGAVATIAGQTTTYKLPKWIDLPPGEYEVTVTAPGFVKRTTKVRLSAARVTVVDASLEEQPATVEFIGDEGCDVVVDGRAVGRTPPSKPLTLPSGNHRIVIGKNGRAVLSRTLILKRGEEEVVDVDLGPTTQRGVAWAFLATGAASTVTGVVFAVLAESRRGQAQTIADRRSDEGRDLTLAEAEEHNAQLDTAKDFVRVGTGAIVAGAVAGALGLTLYVFDEPDLFDSGNADEETDQAKLMSFPMVGATPAGDVVMGLTVTGQF
jgi:PEGA domain